MISTAFSPAHAIWDNRHFLATSLDELKEVRKHLQAAMGGPRDFLTQQWLQLASMVYDFKPDLIVELGRGYGNSTCAMALGAKWLRPHECRIVSLCLSDAFNQLSHPYLKTHLSDPGLLDPVEALETDILTFDFDPVIASAKRVFVFWDAHGFDVAHAILNGLLRPLGDRPHLAVIHDMADLAYLPDSFRRFNDDAEWLKYGTAGPKYILGDVGFQYEEGIALVDFVSRNRLALRSAESSYFADLAQDQMQALEALFAADFSQFGFWYYFSLNWSAGRELSFPVNSRVPEATAILVPQTDSESINQCPTEPPPAATEANLDATERVSVLTRCWRMMYKTMMKIKAGKLTSPVRSPEI
jgi:hypothetical protein